MTEPSSAARARGLALIALAAVSWGTTGSVTTVVVARAGATPLVIGATRTLLAAALLLGLAPLLGGRRRPRGADAVRVAALGVCMAAFQAAYFTAVTLAGIATAALVAICSAPVMIAALAVAVLGERPTRRLAVALVLGVTGTALLIAGPPTTVAPPRALPLGVALALAAGLAYAVYVVLAKAALARVAPAWLAATTFAAAAVIMAPAFAAADVGRQLALAWPWLLYLGVVATALAYTLYTLGLRDVPASVAGIASLVEPLTATALGVVIFGERFGRASALGAALLLMSLVVVAPRDGLFVARRRRWLRRGPRSLGTPRG